MPEERRKLARRRAWRVCKADGVCKADERTPHPGNKIGEQRMNEKSRPWHHRPAHIFIPGMTYIVTSGTLRKERLFCDDETLQCLQDVMFEVLDSYKWRLQAWAIFSNHYHFIAQSEADSKPLKSAIQRLHSQVARALNAMDGQTQRRVWFECWDTCITFEKSYLARLNYVHNNPVKHKLVAAAEKYHFCSASWFQETAEPTFRAKVESFGHDRVKVEDEYA
ncbi:MAG TPA: transposase [Candidatus Brocadiia bacterium]|nr:transposase [Candidatus Brocadiia bacterium]